MRTPLAWMLWLLAASACSASEIVAWKANLSRFAFDGLETEGVVRSQSAPQPLPFFNEGDELWDLTKATERYETRPPLEWVVWNATTGRLVTKSGWNGVGQLYQHFRIHELPRQCRLTAEVFEVSADGSPPSPDSTPAATLTWIARPTIKFEASARRKSDEITVIGTASIDETSEWIDFDLKAGFTIRDLPRREATFAGTLQNAVPLWAVRDHDGDSGLDLRITARVELLDGSPVSDAVLVEKDGAAVALTPDRSEMERQPVANGGWLTSAHFPPAGLESLVREPDESDPFAPSPPDAFHRERLGLDEVQPPAVLKPWLDGSYWDLREVLAKSGMTSGQDVGFAGYDLLRHRIRLFSGNEDDLEKFEEVFGIDWTRMPPRVVVALGPERPMRLITRSGLIGTLTRSTSDGTVLAALTVEPTIGEGDDLIDLRLELRESVGDAFRSINSSVTLATGRPAEVLTGLSPDDPPLRVTADLIRSHP